MPDLTSLLSTFLQDLYEGLGTLTLGSNVTLVAESANTLAQRSGTSAQTFNLYETFTDTSNYSRLTLGFVDATHGYGINAASAGTGTARAITFATNGTFVWRITTAGHLIAVTDNSYDIGASGATRPRNLFIAGAADIAGVSTLASGTATPAGGSTAARTLFGTTAGFGVYYGSGAPTVSAAQGSLYIRSDGSSTSTRAYINTTGSTTWTAITTAA